MTDPDTAPKATEQPIRFRPVISADNLVGMRMDRDGGYVRHQDYAALYAPDHSDWNAAIEAAAMVIDARKSVLEVGTELSDRVRQLKKGPPNDWRKHSTKTEDGYNG